MPHFIHTKNVRGGAALTQLGDLIAYAYEQVPNGGRARHHDGHMSASSAAHDLLRAQTTDHKTIRWGTSMSMKRPRR